MPRLARTTSPSQDPWRLLHALIDGDSRRLPATDLAPHFFDLIATRSTQAERDYLLAKGLGPFGYRLIEACREVETRVLERALAIDEDVE